MMAEIGQKIKMCGERQRYTVQGVKWPFIFATKPFNAQKTYLYTMIDMDRRVRGRLNSIFGLFCDVDSPEGARQHLDEIEDQGGFAVWHVSHRHYKHLTDAEIAQIEGQ